MTFLPYINYITTKLRSWFVTNISLSKDIPITFMFRGPILWCYDVYTMYILYISCSCSSVYFHNNKRSVKIYTWKHCLHFGFLKDQLHTFILKGKKSVLDKKTENPSELYKSHIYLYSFSNLENDQKARSLYTSARLLLFMLLNLVI